MEWSQKLANIDDHEVARLKERGLIERRDKVFKGETSSRNEICYPNF